jgi:hypothetical protein
MLQAIISFGPAKTSESSKEWYYTVLQDMY